MPGLQSEFDRSNCVRLQGLLEPELLDRIRREVDDADFFARDDPLKREQTVRPGRALALLTFIANDPTLFEVVQAITGCPRIGFFEGRVYRMLPGAGHESAWHNDLVNDRLVAMSVNLGSQYEGGVLELRDTSSGETHRVANTGPAETILIRLAPGLEHRVTRLEGDAVKTAFVGFFVAAPERAQTRAATSLQLALAGRESAK